MKIGRDGDHEVTLNNAHVSRTHVELERINGQWTLRSIGRNGTLIKGKVVENYLVDKDVVIQLGKAGPRLQIKVGGEVMEGKSTATIEYQAADLSNLILDREKIRHDTEKLADQFKLDEIANRRKNLSKTDESSKKDDRS